MSGLPGPCRYPRPEVLWGFERVLKLLAFVLPLGLDSFAVAGAIGATHLTTWRVRVRISVLFVLFEAGMPLIGFAAGSGLARLIGPVAGYVAAAGLIGLGIWMLAGRDDDEHGAERIAGARGLAALALGVSISLDEFAIGVGLGLARLPVVPVIATIAVLALVVSQLGLALGALVGERLRERAGQIAGIALILLGGYLIAQRALT
jgi:manganese efflux pump family protein